VLSHIIGDKLEIVFDDRTSATEEEGQRGALARRYHLEGVFLGTLLLVVLYLKNLQLLPPQSDPESLDAVSGRSATAGLMNLLNAVCRRGAIIYLRRRMDEDSAPDLSIETATNQERISSEQKDAVHTYQLIHPDSQGKTLIHE